MVLSSNQSLRFPSSSTYCMETMPRASSAMPNRSTGERSETKTGCSICVHGEESAGHAVLLLRVAREEHALRGGDDGSAAQPLEDAETDERGQVPRQAAERTGGGEDQDRDGVIALEAEALQQPSRHRDDGDVRHCIRGRHPRDLIERRP